MLIWLCYRVLREGFVCTNGTDVQPQSYCNGGPYFNGTFSGGQIADVSHVSKTLRDSYTWYIDMKQQQNFNVSYASGPFLIGQVGYESITFAGIMVPQQEIGLVESAYWPVSRAQNSLEVHA
jgi:hypothetical protein